MSSHQNSVFQGESAFELVPQNSVQNPTSNRLARKASGVVLNPADFASS